MISDLKRAVAEEDNRERMVMASFTAYQLGAGGSSGETFGGYLVKLGVISSEAIEVKPEPEEAGAQVSRLRSMGIEVTVKGE